MPLARNLLRRCRLLLLPAIALVSAGGAAYLANELQSKKAAASAELAAAPSKDPKEKLVRTGEDRLTIPDAIARNMAIRTAVVGIWSLKIMALNFNVPAAVGLISILGVAVMDGLLLVSAFNARRAQGVDLETALIEGVRRRVRPAMITALAAILGLLPAAISTKIGSQSQRPLAVVVGGMAFTLVCLNLVPILYSFYGRRTPPAGAGGMEH